MCVNETLRMFPPFLYNTKTCTKDCELSSPSGDKIKISTDSSIIIPTYAIHHDEDYFNDPEFFCPDRFKDGNLKKFEEQGVFLPFGTGKRKCLGMNFAYVEVKTVVAEIVRNFVVKVNSNTRSDNKLDGSSFVAILEGGIWLDLENIKKTS